ncbi:hypothetical protein MHA_0643 [Mannheimia haemolytica PHL213]|nr:hypothetical protein MHA_0643 [Mannheimia haemolytica PHL213]
MQTTKRNKLSNMIQSMQAVDFCKKFAKFNRLHLLFLS